LLETLIRDKLARVLGTSADRLDTERPLLQLGVDSLMAVELRNWLESKLQVDLQIVELMRSPSVSGLAELLAKRLVAAETVPAQVGSNHRVHGREDGHNRHIHLKLEEPPLDLLARIDELTGDELDSHLAALFAEKGTGHGR
jgi:aryl carrier-like protein